MNQRSILFLLSFFLSIDLFAKPQFLETVNACRSTTSIVIDGYLNEDVWFNTPVTQFYQQNPNQGELCSEKTELWIAYNNDALYVAARLYDSQPDSIVARLARRDNDNESDAFFIMFDTYHDHRTGFYFGISAAGTLYDGVLHNDDWRDNTWNAVWEGVALQTSEGWNVELRIPFSQLRFEYKEQYVFGVNAERRISRKKEQAFLVYTPRNESGFVSRFPHLIGIENIFPPSRFEVVPYVLAKADYRRVQHNNPFHNGSKYNSNAGIDLKVGLGTNITLQATINPDFGQVELDPAVVNLSDVETFYTEKRPFFIEGMNFFSFGLGGVTNFWNFNWPGPRIFYSRRIGRMPQRQVENYDFINMPAGTRILGAAKLTGKVFDGWNIGVIEALTRREYADVDTNGIRYRTEVEPLSLYSIARLQRDFNEGRQGIGAFVGQTQRFFNDDVLRSSVNKNAFIGGIDGWTSFDNQKEYMLAGWIAVSRIEGSSDRMLQIQTNSAHYFQRPDRSYIQIDSSATSLTGTAGRVVFNKQRGKLVLNAAVGWISPGFESNDLGFLFRTDVINYHVTTGYRWLDPTEYYRSVVFLSTYFRTTDFGGTNQFNGLWNYLWYRFTNYHSVECSYTYGFPFYDVYKTRGGPAIYVKYGREYNIEYSTDSRRDVKAVFDYYEYNGQNGRARNYQFNLVCQPWSSLSIALGPKYSISNENDYWLRTETDQTAIYTGGKRYIFASLDYKEISAQFRVDWTLTPMLSFQIFLQPLFSKGVYSNFHYLQRSRSNDFIYYGMNNSSFEVRYSEDGSVDKYLLDADGNGPSVPVSLDNPDFSSVSLRGSAVLRWEYLPGSTIYLVWNHNRFENTEISSFQFRPLMKRLERADPNSIIMLKWTYWLGA